MYESTVVSYSELKSGNIVGTGSVRIPYYTRQSFKNTTKLLGLMDDFRVTHPSPLLFLEFQLSTKLPRNSLINILLQSGVPRSGYRGVVTFFYNGRRVHLAPSANWSGYDITWS